RRFLQGGVWSAWKQVETTSSVQAKIDAAIKSNVAYYEWFMTANNAQPFFDATAQTLFWSSPLIAPSRNHTANRIYIPAGSIVCDLAANPNAVLYLDLTKVPSSGTLTTDDIPLCLKFASYPTWRGEPTLVPIAKRDRTQNGGVALTACDGFVRIKNSFENSIPTSAFLEWQKVANTTSVIFNKETKVLNISGYLLAPYNNASGRIRIQDISIQFVNNFDIAYLDLTALGSTLDINATNKDQFIKVLPYSNTSGYRAKTGQVALAKYFSVDNMLTPAAGFVAISHIGGTSGQTENSSDYFQFTKTETLLSAYLPTTNGKKIKIGLKRQVVPFDGTSPDSQSDLWRLYEAWRVDSDTLTQELMVCNNGEWECAIQVVGSSDHVGGYHGDELQTSSIFYIDGVSYPQDVVKSGNAKSISFSQESIIYFQNTQTPMAKHKKMLMFTKAGIVLKQIIEFLADANLATAWLTMVPIMRTVDEIQITDKSSRSDDFFMQIDDNTNEGFPRRYTPIKDGTKVKVWGDSSKVSLEVELLKTAGWNTNQNVFVTNGGGYNKIYVSAFNGANTSGTAVAAGTVWENETFFKLDIAS
ncbi:hypothetical protein ABTC33_18015, partial [Acinetobacter baumannii]